MGRKAATHYDEDDLIDYENDYDDDYGDDYVEEPDEDEISPPKGKDKAKTLAPPDRRKVILPGK